MIYLNRKIPFYVLLILTFGLTAAKAHLTVYEGFDYTSPLGNQGGGVGWFGNWQSVDAVNSDASDLTIDSRASLQPHEVFSSIGMLWMEPFVTTGGCVSQTSGQSGSGCRMLGEEALLDLNVNAMYYLSFSFMFGDHEQNDWNTEVALASNDLNKKVVRIIADNNGYIRVLFNEINYTCDVTLLPDKTYFLVLKMSAQDDSSDDNYDQVFLKVYDTQTPVELQDIGFDENDWSLLSEPAQNSAHTIDMLCISGAEFCNFKIDEIRMGTDWFDVVSQQPDSGSNFRQSNDKSDINGDCSVDLLDFAHIAENWLKCSDPLTDACDQYWLE